MSRYNLLWENEAFNLERLEGILTGFISRSLESIFIAKWSREENRLVRSENVLCVYEKGCNNQELWDFINSEIDKSILEEIYQKHRDGYARTRRRNDIYEQCTIYPIQHLGIRGSGTSNLSNYRFLIAFASQQWDNPSKEIPPLHLTHYEFALLGQFAKAQEKLSEGTSKSHDECKRELVSTVSEGLIREYRDNNNDARVFNTLQYVYNNLQSTDIDLSLEAVTIPYKIAIIAIIIVLLLLLIEAILYFVSS